jgi:ABC-type uncharacterized transport system fused permease/ATPase subunit
MVTKVAWNNYGAEVTALEWRQAITERMQAELFRPMMAYTMGSLDKRIDNTDQVMIYMYCDYHRLTHHIVFIVDMLYVI